MEVGDMGGAMPVELLGVGTKAETAEKDKITKNNNKEDRERIAIVKVQILASGSSRIFFLIVR